MKNNQDDVQEGGARIQDLPASDRELAAQDREREKPSPLRAPPEQGEPDEPEDAQRGSPPPEWPSES